MSPIYWVIIWIVFVIVISSAVSGCVSKQSKTAANITNPVCIAFCRDRSSQIVIESQPNLENLFGGTISEGAETKTVTQP